MRQMKDSGIEWIGEIPENWGIERGKNIMSKLERSVLEDDGVITCFRDGEVTLRSNRREEGFTVSLQETGYQGVEKGDLVVHGMDGFAGSIGISDSRGKATPVLNVLDSNEDKKYLMYYMRSAAFCGLFLSLATGIRIRTSDTNWNKLKNVLYLVPPLPEQQAIAAHLDRQCAHIDNIIEKTKASIEEYKKLRQAVITQAVTKGVRGDRSMKDSGIAWIGEIPKDWEICKFKHIICKKIDNRGRTPELLDSNNGIPVVEVASLGKKHPDLSLVKKYISKESHDEYIRDDVEKGDLLITTVGATIGKCSIVDVPDFCIAQNLVGYRVNRNNYPLFWYYYFQSFAFQDMFALYDKGNTINNVKISNMEQGKIVVTKFDEQLEIAAYLEKKCTEIDCLISKKEQFLTELESYKKSMIYEYVTGKKEVPQS